MIKANYQKEIDNRLPDDIVFFDETLFEISDDEFISILCWIKYFNAHYLENGKDKNPEILFPIISKRLRLDFGLYRFPSNTEEKKGKHVIYLSQNGKFMNGTFKKNITINELINDWRL